MNLSCDLELRLSGRNTVSPGSWISHGNIYWPKRPPQVSLVKVTALLLGLDIGPGGERVKL